MEVSIFALVGIAHLALIDGHYILTLNDMKPRSYRLQIGNEHMGRKGLAVLVSAAIVSAGLAIHGYGGATAASGNQLAVGSTSTVATNSSSTTTTQAASPVKGQSSTSTTSPKLGPLLSSTQYASLAYQIYPGPITAKAKIATTGFNVQVKISGNNELVSVAVPGSTSPPQTSTFPKGDSVYFIEATLGDDSGNSDYSAGDDGVVVTNPQGRIVQ